MSKTLREETRETNPDKEYSDLAKTNSRTSLRDLNDLCGKRVFEKIGITGRNTQYVLTRHKRAKGAKKVPNFFQKEQLNEI